MLIMLGNRLVNLDHVQYIAPVPEAELPPGHGPEVRVTFTDGEAYDGGCDLPSLDDCRGLSGAIVPAPPGLVMVEQMPAFDVTGNSEATYVSSPILAFRSPSEVPMPTIRRFPDLPDVHCSGEALGSPVHRLGQQWAVTKDGVERLSESGGSARQPVRLV